MTARVWTVAELDKVWPLPKTDGKRHKYPWAWRIDADGLVAHEVGWSEANEVWVDQHGNLASSTGEPPADVALAVIGANLGHDSPEWMACEAERLAGQWSAAPGSEVAEWWAAAKREALGKVATMLRRGRVEP